MPINDEEEASMSDEIPLTESDYLLPKDRDSVWIRVNNISVYIVRTDEGVVVDLFPQLCEDGTAMASTYAFFDEAEPEAIEA